MVYGRWSSYTCMKQNYKTSCNCFKCGGEEAKGGIDKGGNVTNVQRKSNWNYHYETLRVS
jgi:hypothetical protein